MSKPPKPTDAPYGYCPTCGGVGMSRERRMDGNDKCSNGHSYPSSSALTSLNQIKIALNMEREAKTIAQFKKEEQENWEMLTKQSEYIKELEGALKSFSDYLSSNPLNQVGSDSILHRQAKRVLAQNTIPKPLNNAQTGHLNQQGQPSDDSAKGGKNTTDPDTLALNALNRMYRGEYSFDSMTGERGRDYETIVKFMNPVRTVQSSTISVDCPLGDGEKLKIIRSGLRGRVCPYDFDTELTLLDKIIEQGHLKTKQTTQVIETWDFKDDGGNECIGFNSSEDREKYRLKAKGVV